MLGRPADNENSDPVLENVSKPEVVEQQPTTGLDQGSADQINEGLISWLTPNDPDESLRDLFKPERKIYHREVIDPPDMESVKQTQQSQETILPIQPPRAVERKKRSYRRRPYYDYNHYGYGPRYYGDYYGGGFYDDYDPGLEFEFYGYRF